MYTYYDCGYSFVVVTDDYCDDPAVRDKQERVNAALYELSYVFEEDYVPPHGGVCWGSMCYVCHPGLLGEYTKQWLYRIVQGSGRCSFCGGPSPCLRED
jgi:hypothetical protein